MKLTDIFKKENASAETTKTVTTKTTVETVTTTSKESTVSEEDKSKDEVSPKEVGRLDMVIAFDTTGSMAAYIGAVRKQVRELVPIPLRMYRGIRNSPR